MSAESLPRADSRLAGPAAGLRVHPVTASTAIDLDTYTDPVAMRALLQTQLPGFAEGRLRIDSLAVRNARRNTSRQRNPCPMTLCYELQVSDPMCGRAGTQLLYAQVFRSGEAATAFAQQDRSRLTPPRFGQALTHLPGLNLLLWALPNDPGLPQLARLLDPAQAARELPRTAVGDVQVELLNYQPQRRATLRYTLIGGGNGGGNGNEGRTASRTLYAKTFCDHQAAALHERFAYFWQLSQHDDQAPLVAQPLGHDAVTRTLWQAPALGTPLLRCLSPTNGAELLGRVAQALALLHAAPLSLALALAPSAGGAARSVAHWLAEVRRRQQKIGRFNAALAARATRVADVIEAHAVHQAARPLSLIHGDFHPEQVWVHDGRIVLFDFDEFTLGDPMEDLAEFVLKLEHAGVSPALAAAFVEQYAAAAPQRFDHRSLAWHGVVQSLLQASRAFIYQQPGWAATLERRLATSEARAAALSNPDAP